MLENDIRLGRIKLDWFYQAFFMCKYATIYEKAVFAILIAFYERNIKIMFYII